VSSAVFFLMIALFFSIKATNTYSQQKDSSIIAVQSSDSSMVFRERESLIKKEQSSFFGYLVRVIFVTAIVIVLIIFGLKSYKKYILHNVTLSQNRIRILGRQAVGHKQYVVIIVLGNRKYALGVTDHSVNLITDMGEIDEKEEQEESVQAPIAFSSFFKKITGVKND
jgi:flagellar biogenesis protein FliO